MIALTNGLKQYLVYLAIMSIILIVCFFTMENRLRNAVVFFGCSNAIIHLVFLFVTFKKNDENGQVGRAFAAIGIKFILLLISFIAFKLIYDFQSKADAIGFLITYVAFLLPAIYIAQKK